MSATTHDNRPQGNATFDHASVSEAAARRRAAAALDDLAAAGSRLRADAETRPGLAAALEQHDNLANLTIRLAETAGITDSPAT